MLTIRRKPADPEDMAELFRARRVAQQAKRAENKAKSTDILQREGVPFVSKNDGVHLIVAGRWDFWPSTGKWQERQGVAGQKKRAGRGVFNLITIVQKEAT